MKTDPVHGYLYAAKKVRIVLMDQGVVVELEGAKMMVVFSGSLAIPGVLTSALAEA